MTGFVRRDAFSAEAPQAAAEYSPRPLLRAVCVGCLALVVLFLGLSRRRRESAEARRKGEASAWISRRFCALLRLRVAVAPPDLREPTLVVANHVSWADALALGALGNVCFLAKSEVASWPLFGRLARLQGGVFVERKRRMLIPKVNREIADRLASGLAVVVFPEATTGDGTRVRRFHSSHLEAAAEFLRRSPERDHVKILPAAIVYRTRRGLPLGRAGRAAAAWYGDADFLPSFMAALGGGPLSCEISFAPAFAFRRGDSRKDAAARAGDAVRQLVARQLAARNDMEPAAFTSNTPVSNALDPPPRVADSPADEQP